MNQTSYLVKKAVTDSLAYPLCLSWPSKIDFKSTILRERSLLLPRYFSSLVQNLCNEQHQLLSTKFYHSFHTERPPIKDMPFSSRKPSLSSKRKIPRRDNRWTLEQETQNPFLTWWFMEQAEMHKEKLYLAVLSKPATKPTLTVPFLIKRIFLWPFIFSWTHFLFTAQKLQQLTCDTQFIMQLQSSSEGPLFLDWLSSVSLTLLEALEKVLRNILPQYFCWW